MSQKLYLKHSGTPQKFDYDPNGSGRYRQGSGENPHQHGFDWYYESNKLLQPVLKNGAAGGDGLSNPDELIKWYGNQNTTLKNTVGKIINPETGKPYTKTEAIKAYLHMSTDEYRRNISSAKVIKNQQLVTQVTSRREKGMSEKAIAEDLGIRKEKVTKILAVGLDAKNKQIKEVADYLKAQVDRYKYVDVGDGVQRRIGVTEEVLKNAIKYLQISEGYSNEIIKIDQLQAQQQGQKTTNKVLSAPTDKTGKEIRSYLYDHLNEIHMVDDNITGDLELTIRGMDRRPLPLDSKRIEINYADKNGFQPKDGVIEIRPGVADLWLGPNTSYSQVRINVDDQYYLKGMAIYSNDLPKGVDVRFNTNKMEGTPMSKVFKPMKREKKLENGDPDPNSPVDWKNPFGAAIMSEEKGGQYDYTDKDGTKKQSLINKVNSEGSWAEWNRSFIPQFGSKQPREVIEKQLNWEYEDRLAELEDLKKITNPVVKRDLLNDFANSCDTNSADLRGHAMSRQTQRVLLPIESLKTAFTEAGEELPSSRSVYNECYAPGYHDNEHLALIRFPHNGPCEILECVVNNQNKQAIETFAKYGGERDVIAINPRGAIKLSGADFDGDSVCVIPAKGIQIEPLMREMAGFDGKLQYPYREGIKVCDHKTKGREMGTVTNLIADMGQMGASNEEMARAIKYSQVIIDAEKHKLDWQRAKEELKIKELYKFYTGRSEGGAKTFVTRAKSKREYDEVGADKKIDPETGNVILRPTGHTHKKWLRPDENGNFEFVYEKNKTKMKRAMRVDDAYDLLSTPGHPETAYWQEVVYADFSNQMKDLARQARLEILATKNDPINKESVKTYAKEVAELDKKLDKVKSQIQYEREAQRVATYELKAIKETYGKMEKDEESKKKAQLLSSARRAIYPKGKREKIDITDREWEAIQANAISATKLKEILNQADDDQIRSYATPKNPQNRVLSDARIRQIQRMYNSGNEKSRPTIMELADEFHVSEATIRSYLSLEL